MQSLPPPKRKKFRQETIIHSFLTRPLAQEIVLLLWKTNITANQMTWFRIVLNIIALLLFLTANKFLIVIGFVLFQIHEILDAADGLLARLKKQTSHIGEFIEKFFDEIFSTGYGLMGFVIAVAAVRISGDHIYLYLFAISAIGKLIASSFGYYFPASEDGPPDQETQVPHYYQIMGVSWTRSMKNLVITVYIWQNQLLLWGLLFFDGFRESGFDPLIFGFALSAVLNHIVWVDKGYRAYKNLPVDK